MKHFLWSKRIYLLILLIFLGISIFVLTINIYILNVNSQFIFQSSDDVPAKQVAVVLGAKVYSNGVMSTILKDRELTALELYKNKKVQKILVSGDHGREDYDEVNAMKDFLLNNGVLGEDIFLDHAGFDTYYSIYRAKEIFQVSSIIIVTQKFHLFRAVYIAKSLGIDAIGIVADRQDYVLGVYNESRESLARVKAFFDLTFQSKPKFLGEIIPIIGDSKLTWDKA